MMQRSDQPLIHTARGNLPVADLEKSKAFYQALGYALNPQMSGDGAASVHAGCPAPPRADRSGTRRTSPAAAACASGA